MKILVVQQPLRNRGDESAHRGIITQLSSKFPSAEIDILFISANENDINEFKVNSPKIHYININLIRGWNRVLEFAFLLHMPILMYLFPPIWKVVNHLKKADVLICAPGGMDLGGFYSWSHLGILWLATSEKNKSAYFARSIGPFAEDTYIHHTFKYYAKRLLERFDFVSLRDKKSQLIASKLGIHYIPTADSAFLVTPEAEIPQVFVTNVAKSEYMVLVPNCLIWHPTFRGKYSYSDILQFWIQLTDALLMEYPSMKIVMLPQTTYYDIDKHPDGYQYFSEIRKKCLNKDRIYVLEEKYGSNVQQTIIADAKFLIGARYHSIVFAINQCTPFVSLSYEHKMSGIVEIVGKEELEVDICRFLNGRKIEEVGQLIISEVVNKTHVCNISEDDRNKAKTIALNGFDKLVSCIQ